MDVASLSIAMSHADTSTKVGVAMMSKALDMVEQNGEILIDMMKDMQVPVDSSRGSVIDFRV